MVGGAKVYSGSNGWAIGAEIDNGTTEFQNEVDASSLYQLLENQIVPLYYAKPDGKLPLAWLQLMRESIRSVTPVFNTQRMVKEYTEQLYIPAAQAHENLSRDGCGAATHLSQWKTQDAKGLGASAGVRRADSQQRSAKHFRRRIVTDQRARSPGRSRPTTCAGRSISRRSGQRRPP